MKMSKGVENYVSNWNPDRKNDFGMTGEQFLWTFAFVLIAMMLLVGPTVP
jgi:hypothetical protein